MHTPCGPRLARPGPLLGRRRIEPKHQPKTERASTLVDLSRLIRYIAPGSPRKGHIPPRDRFARSAIKERR
jgi:hypothetical protein